MRYSDFHDDAQARIDDRLEQIAEYDEGDVVTVEPSDNDIRHSASHLVRTPLIVDEIRCDDRLNKHKGPSYYHDHDEDRVLEVQRPPSWDHPENTIELYLPTPRYSFKRHRFGGHDTPIQTTVSEHSLLPWDEYDGPVSLTVKWDTRATYKDTLSERDEPCDICGSTTVRKKGKYEDPIGFVGQKLCAVCGVVHAEMHP